MPKKITAMAPDDAMIEILRLSSELVREIGSRDGAGIYLRARMLKYACADLEECYRGVALMKAASKAEPLEEQEFDW